MGIAVSEKDTEAYVLLARIGKPRGVHGHFYIWPIADNLERFQELRKVYLVSRRARLTTEVEEFAVISGKPVLKVKDIDAPEDIKGWTGGSLEIDETDRVVLPEGEYFHDQLVGLNVVDPAGKTLGVITRILESPANDVYECRLTDGRTTLIPAVEEIVLEINLEAGTITIEPIPGLLDE